jgi:hypothetical protein
MLPIRKMTEKFSRDPKVRGGPGGRGKGGGGGAHFDEKSTHQNTRFLTRMGRGPYLVRQETFRRWQYLTPALSVDVHFESPPANTCHKHAQLCSPLACQILTETLTLLRLPL